MAKFASVTYGTHGDTKEYTYIVNDNVRAGDYLQPTVKHYISKKIFATTGIVQNTAREASVVGQNRKQALEKDGVTPVKAYTGSEVGVKKPPTSRENGKFVSGTGLAKTVINEEGKRVAPDGQKFVETAYISDVRKGNVQKRETYEEYASKFTNKGDS